MLERVRELAARALSHADSSDEVQATVRSERSLLSRFTDSCPTQATAVTDVTIELAVVDSGRVGASATNRTTDQALAELAAAARTAAHAAARAGNGTYPGLTSGPLSPETQTVYDPETAELDPSFSAWALREIFDEGKRFGVACHGVFTQGEVATAIMSSTGIDVAEAATDCFTKVTAEGPRGRTGYASQTTPRVRDIEPRRVCARAGAKAAVDSPPASFAAGRFTAVFEPAAVAELVGWLGQLAFNGLLYAEGRSALCGRLGTQVVAPSIELRDSPAHPQTLARGFDLEATAKRELSLIKEGVAQAICHDRKTAALSGTDSTGHALEPGGASFGAVPTNLCLSAGHGGSTHELVASIERGVYVTRLWYTNPVRPRETLITATTRDGTFLIEDGQVTSPLADLRMTDSVLSILSETQAVGSEPTLESEGQFYGRRFAHGVVCPALRAESVRFDP